MKYDVLSVVRVFIIIIPLTTGQRSRGWHHLHLSQWSFGFVNVLFLTGDHSHCLY